MGTDTPNKRKSSSNADKTPNKIQKLSRTSVSKTVKNKSPKAAIKVNQKQIHGNKSAKSPNQNQKNGKQVTPKGGKKTKQTEKIISDDESDDSMDELNENNDNSSDATDEEVYSNEDADIAEEADSEDEAEMKEEVDSNLKIIMGTNTPNKRKSSSNANSTPNKIQKLSRTSVSKAVKNKSPKAATKVNQKQIHGNKSVKSPNKNKKNGKQVTPKGGKKTEQTEKIISDDESDDSMDELNENNDNSSDATDEVDSNEDADIAEEADSEDEAEMKEEVDSNEEQVDEEEADESDQESDSADELKKDADETKNNCQVSSYSVFVTGLKPEVYFNAVFPGCNIKFCRWFKDENYLLPGEAYVVFNDQESMTKALAKDKSEFDGSVIRVKAKDMFCVNVFGIDENTNFSKIFPRCNIISSIKYTKKKTNKLTGRAIVYFEDKESLEIALENKQIKDNGRIITVQDALNKNIKLLVTGLEPHENITNIFPECFICEVKIMRHPVTKELTGTAFLTVTNDESVKKALEKNGTKYGNSILTVEPFTQEKFYAIHKKLSSEKRKSTAVVKKEHFKETGFTASVTHISSYTKIEDVFKDCKMQSYYTFKYGKSNQSSGKIVHFEDEEGLLKALSKNGTVYGGRVIRVEREDCSVFVKGLNADSEIEDLFKDCKIQRIELIKNKSTNEFSGKAIVNFKDKESFEKALSKNNTKLGDRTVTVLVYWKKNPNSGKTTSYLKPVRKSFGSGDKIAFLKKQLLAELKAEARQLELEIYGNTKQH